MQNFYDVKNVANRRLRALFPDLPSAHEVEVRDVEHGGGYHPTYYSPGLVIPARTLEALLAAAEANEGAGNAPTLSV